MNILQLEPAKYIRYYSDMHQDFYVNSKKFSPSQLWNPEPLPEDSETILILAGDIWHAKKPFYFSNHSWFKDLAAKFKYLLIVLGNHDFWGGSFPTEYENFERYKKDLGINNLFLLQNETLIIGNNKFIGATLWTNYNDQDAASIECAHNISSDLKYIRYNDPRFKGTFKKTLPKHFISSYNYSKNYIFENAKKDYPDQKLWVITHFPPSQILVNDPELDKDTMGLVANNLDSEIEKSEIDFWIHGHNHQSGSAKIGNTLILANTVGYHSEKDSNAKLNANYNSSIQLALS